jgi:hypothetical protein
MSSLAPVLEAIDVKAMDLQRTGKLQNGQGIFSLFSQ